MAVASAGALVPTFALWLGLAIDRRLRARTEKPPQTEKLLRPPGYSLSQKLDQIVDSVLNNLLFAGFFCGGAALFAQPAADALGGSRPWWWIAFMIGTFLGFASGALVLFVRAVRLIITARHYRLGLRGEQVVAECLNEVADAGYRSFHDLPAGDNWNIDHVAVGPQGVFLVETKTRNRRGSRPDHPAHEVRVNKKTLHFPTFVNSTAIPQAEHSAKWLANYLEKKTGEKVPVTPLVVLPGWFVTHKEPPSTRVEVMNPKFMVSHLRCKPANVLPAPQLKRIITALDEKCRDIEF